MQVQRWTTEKRLASNSVYGQGLKYAGLKEVDKVLIPIHNIAKNHWVRNSGCPTGDCANSMQLTGRQIAPSRQSCFVGTESTWSQFTIMLQPISPDLSAVIGHCQLQRQVRGVLLHFAPWREGRRSG
jgi:hypothetical protein